MHLWLGVLFIAVMGFVLGLLGGGGSMLTVSILAYVLDIEAPAAISFSLILVGGTALLAALLNVLGASVSWRFSGTLLFLLFGALMGVAGAAMLRKRSNMENSEKLPNIWPVVISGAAVGFLAGFLGVGGGFLIVPSLVLFLHMPMKLATGTSGGCPADS